MYCLLSNDEGEWNHAWTGHDVVEVECEFNLSSDDEPDLVVLTFYDSEGRSLRMHNFSKRVLDQFDAWFASLDRADLHQMRADAIEEMLGDMVESEIDYAKEQQR